MKWALPAPELSPSARLIDQIMSDHDFSGLLEALKRKTPKFPEDFKETRPFWTGHVQLAPISKRKIGDEIKYILSFMRDVGGQPMTSKIVELPVIWEGNRMGYIVEGSHGRLKIYEDEIIEDRS